MVWKLIYIIPMTGMLEVATYSDLDECKEMAREMVVAQNEGDRWASQGETINVKRGDDAYGCIPVPD